MALSNLVWDSFKPDASVYGLDGLLLAQNVYPFQGKWREVRDLVSRHSYSSKTAENSSGWVEAKGFWSFSDPDLDGIYYSIVNTAGTLHLRHSSTPGVANSVGSFITWGGSRGFNFARFGEWVIAFSYSNQPQKRIDSANFSNLIPSGDKPFAHFGDSCRGRMIFANVKFGSTNYKSRVWWSKRNDATVYTPGPLSSDPGFIDLQDNLDEITGIVAWDDSFVLLRSQGVELWSFTVGGETPWTRRHIGGPADGMHFGYQPVKSGRECYYLSHSGFKVIRGQSIESIDNGIGHFFLGGVPYGGRDKWPELRGTVDPQSGCIVFSYNPLQTPPEIAVAVYNPAEDRWSVIHVDGKGQAPVAIASYRPQDTNSAFGFLNDLLLITGETDTVHHYTFTSGTSMPILMRSRRARFTQTGQTRLKRVRPVFSLADAAWQPHAGTTPAMNLVITDSRHPLFETSRVTTIDSSEQDEEGFFQGVPSGRPLPITSNYFQFDLNIPGFAIDEDLPLQLTELLGLEVEHEPAGRGR